MSSNNKKIDELTGNTLHLQDVFPVVDNESGKTHKASIQDIKDLIGAGGSSGVVIINGQDEPSHDLSDITQFAILVDAETQPIECILPTPTLGKHYVFKKIDSTANVVRINSNLDNQATIDGEFSQYLYQQYQSITVISDGNNWFIL